MAGRRTFKKSGYKTDSNCPLCPKIGHSQHHQTNLFHTLPLTSLLFSLENIITMAASATVTAATHTPPSPVQRIQPAHRIIGNKVCTWFVLIRLERGALLNSRTQRDFFSLKNINTFAASATATATAQASPPVRFDVLNPRSSAQVAEELLSRQCGRNGRQAPEPPLPPPPLSPGGPSPACGARAAPEIRR